MSTSCRLQHFIIRMESVSRRSLLSGSPQLTYGVRLRRGLRGLGVPMDIMVVSERYAEEWGGVQNTMVHAALSEGQVLHAAA